MITVVLNRPSPPPTEGASSRIHAIVDHLRAVDPHLRVLVAAPRRGSGAGRWRRMWAAVRLPALAVRTLSGPGRLVLLSAPALPFFDSPSRMDLLLASSFLRVLRAGARLRGAVLVLNLHDFRSLQLPDFGVEVTEEALAIFRKMEVRSLKACDYILAPGGDWPGYIRSHFGIPQERLVDFPNGCVRTDAAAPGSDLPDLPGRVRFVYAGTMTPRGRGLERMVESFRQVRNEDASLILMGPGGEWCREAAGGDPRIRYLGAQPVERCIAILKECHVALYPYPDLFYFAMTHTTNKMALYLACGLPLLANRSRAVERFVRERHLGVACAMEEMTGQMEEMAASPERLAAWKARAREAGRDFLWDAIIDRAFGEICRREGLALPAGMARAGSGEREAARAN